MKNTFLFCLALLFSLGFQNCVREYNEFGEDSVFYYLNGTPVVPTCHTLFNNHPINVELTNNDLNVHICGDININYTIKHYQGKGLYEMNSANQNTCTIQENTTQYHAIDNHKTFMRVLELDTIAKHFSAVFEADLVDDTNHYLKITKGRMDVKYAD